MDIFEYAMQMEKDGETYYRDLVAKTSNKGLKAVLTMMADDEVKHYNTINQMKAGVAAMPDTKVLEGAKNIFASMKESGEKFEESTDQIDFYKKAQELEEKSRQFYSEKAAEAGNDENKQLLMRIADEEQKHYNLLGSIIEFVSRPTQWLEDAEWYHLDEY
jgi:rubrerythrin